MLKGPTGCGKTRFIEHMAWRLGRPLVTVAAHEDMTAADLAGRYLLAPEARLARRPADARRARRARFCYLDEIVEARQDTTVVIHPLTDARRILPLDKKNEIVPRMPISRLTISYNPRLPERGERPQGIDETAVRRDRVPLSERPASRPRSSSARARRSRSRGDPRGYRRAVRNLRGRGLDEGASTRMLIHAARLVGRRVPVARAVQSGIVLPITDDADVREALTAAIAARLSRRQRHARIPLARARLVEMARQRPAPGRWPRPRARAGTIALPVEEVEAWAEAVPRARARQCGTRGAARRVFRAAALTLPRAGRPAAARR